jgi:hypothetical protein
MAVLELNEIQEKVLETVRTSQESIADAVKGIAEKIPSLPYPEQLPKPAELVDRAVGFAGQVLETQRSFAKKVVDAFPVGS